MRSRKVILADHSGYEKLTLEVLLDIRETLVKAKPKKERRKKVVKPNKD